MDNFRDSYFQINWDLGKKRLNNSVWGKQYDTGRGLAITIKNNGVDITPTNKIIRLKWEKSDKTAGYVNSVIVGNEFIIENIDQMFTVAGMVKADLELWVAGEVVSSVTFYVAVDKAIAIDAIESSSEFTALQEALNGVDGVKSGIEVLETNKADKTTTYTKTEVDDKVVLKADKTYTDAELDKKSDKSTTYTKTEVDGKVNPAVSQLTEIMSKPSPFFGGYSWWVYPNIVEVEPNGITILSCVNSIKQTLIYLLNSKTKMQQKYVVTTDLVSDEHNTASICVMPDQRILTAHSKHDTENIIRVRRSVNPLDISTFEAPIELTASGTVTYSQLLYRGGKYYLFYRVNINQWALRISSDGLSWGAEIIFLTAQGQYYIRIAQYNFDNIRIALIGHPINSADHDIRYGSLQLSTGNFRNAAGTTLGNINGTSLPIAQTAFTSIFHPPASARLFDINSYPASSKDVAIAHATFSNANDCIYQVTTGNVTTGFKTSTVCNGGKPLEIPAGTNYYFGGMWFERNNDSIVYVARESAGIWKLEKYTTTDYLTWTLSETIASDTLKIHRPCIPFAGQTTTQSGNLVWEKGFYTTYEQYDSVVMSKKWWYI